MIDIEVIPWPEYSPDGRTDWWRVRAKVGRELFLLDYSLRERRFADSRAARQLVAKHGVRRIAAAESAVMTTLGA